METALPLDQKTSVLSKWNYLHLFVSLAVGLLLQIGMLPCLCAIGDWRMKIALWFNLMILLRITAAFLMKQTGDGWIIYTLMSYTSAFWILGITQIMLKASGKSH